MVYAKLLPNLIPVLDDGGCGVDNSAILSYRVRFGPAATRTMLTKSKSRPSRVRDVGGAENDGASRRSAIAEPTLTQ